MAESWRKWLSAWDGYRIEAEEYRELDAERVIVFNRYGGRGKTSGLEIGEAGGTKAATLFHELDKMPRRVVAAQPGGGPLALGLRQVAVAVVGPPG